MIPRAADQLRPVQIERNYLSAISASVLYRAGETVVLCTASVSEEVPPWLEGKGRGWVTAEYNMLPHSTRPRKRRERDGKVDGRTTEIQRLIGRSLRSIVNLELLGPRLVTVDCDVLQADGGTRTAAITGGFVALVDALAEIMPDPTGTGGPIAGAVAATSVGIVGGKEYLDLDYALDSTAEVDMNVVMTDSGRFVEIQGTGENATFTDEQLTRMLALARNGIRELLEKQQGVIRA